MFKIGDFSKLSQLSVKTLRYYSFEQLHRLNRILALKDLGLSLEQIVQLLNEEIPANTIRGMLMIKQNELQQQLQEEQERLHRVSVRVSKRS